MVLKWTNKALSDLTRLYDFLRPVNKPAAIKAVRALVKAPDTLLRNPRIGEQLFQFAPSVAVHQSAALAGRSANGSRNTSGQVICC